MTQGACLYSRPYSVSVIVQFANTHPQRFIILLMKYRFSLPRVRDRKLRFIVFVCYAALLCIFINVLTLL